MSFSKRSFTYSQNAVAHSWLQPQAAALKVEPQYQAAVTSLSFQALAGAELNTLYNEAVKLVQNSLDVDYVSLLELLSDGNTLRNSAGTGWRDNLVGQVSPDVQIDLYLGSTLNSNEPVFIRDLRTQTHIPVSSQLQEHGVVSGILVSVPGQERSLGILGAYTKQKRTFTQDEIHFLQAVTNGLGTAIERQRVSDLLREQNYVLEMIATAAPLESVLNSICYRLEQLSPGAVCFILLLDKQHNHLCSGSAPSLPVEFTRVFDRLPIKNGMGSCGTAAYRRESVFVEDIATDPLWLAFRDFALLHNIRACWSTPFFSKSGEVLGTFAIAHSVPCRPTAYHLALMQTATHLASVATERKRTEEALSKASEELEICIEKRTAQLRQTNERLMLEVAQRQQVEAQLKMKAQHLEQICHQLQQAQVQLEQSEKMSSLGRLVAGVAHEINNPINFINGNIAYAVEYVQDLLKLLQLYQSQYSKPASEILCQAEAIDLDFLKEDLPKLFCSMKVGADRICEIVQSLRNFSHIDEAEVKGVDIHDGINSTLMILQSRLKATPKRPAIQVVKEYGDLPLVECYVGQLNQVFMNVITNAIDALEEDMELEQASGRQLSNRLPKEPRIRIRTEVFNVNWVAIRIADNGLGISEVVQRQLFDPFFTTKPVGKGTGMGMSISYSIVTEKHKGRLRCVSQLGQGAEFIIEIPLRQSR